MRDKFHETRAKTLDLKHPRPTIENDQIKIQDFEEFNQSNTKTQSIKSAGPKTDLSVQFDTNVSEINPEDTSCRSSDIDAMGNSFEYGYSN